jgi:low affinity Fe/Cu permease
MSTIEAKPIPKKNFFEAFATRTTQVAGSTGAFIVAVLVVLIWIATGPIFHYSNTWQLVINTGTTIITFLMVFLIQKSQNKDALAIQLKLNELVAAHELASNRLVSVEDMTEDELRVLQKYYSKLAVLAKKEETLQQSHSIEEAQQMTDLKKALEEDKTIRGNGELPGAA